MLGFGNGGAPQLEWANATAADIDPAWSRDKVERWMEWATENIEGVNYFDGSDENVGPANDRQGFDFGIRALLYDLNTRGYYTWGSNLASSGSRLIWHPYVNLTEGVNPPRGVYDELDRRAPRGYYAYAGQEAYQRKGMYNVGYAHESCSDPADINSCSHEPGPDERAQVDSAFINAVRSVI